MAEAPKPSQIRADLPQAIDDVVTRGMAKAPDDRFATAGELVRGAGEALNVPGRAPQVSAVGAGHDQSHRSEPREGVRSRRGAFLAVGGVVGVLAIVALVFAVTRRSAPSSGPPTSSPSAGVAASGKALLVAFDPKTGKPSGSPVALGKGTGTLTIGFGAVWVANADEDTVTRIDPTTRRVVATIHVGNGPLGIAVGEGDPNVWVVTKDSLWGIDPVTNSVIATVHLDSLPSAIAVGHGSIWVTYHIIPASGEGLYRIDPSTRTVTEKIDVTPSLISAVDVAIGEAPGVVWVLDPIVGGGNPGHLLRVGTLREHIDSTVLTSPIALAVEASAVWVLEASGAVSRVDPDSLKVVARIGTSSGASSIAVGEGGVWVVNRSKGSITRIDPATNQNGAPVALGGSPSSVAVGDGVVWVRLDGSP
jgi:YVTN family beta-propeller protein